MDHWVRGKIHINSDGEELPSMCLQYVKTFLFVCMHESVSGRCLMHTYSHVLKCACVYMCARVYVLNLYVWKGRVCTQIILMYGHAYACLFACIHVCTCLCTYLRMYVCMYVFMYIYIYISDQTDRQTYRQTDRHMSVHISSPVPT
jgi:hypothetical protein